jgi:hypothetical protein
VRQADAGVHHDGIELVRRWRLIPVAASASSPPTAGPPSWATAITVLDLRDPGLRQILIPGPRHDCAAAAQVTFRQHVTRHGEAHAVSNRHSG